jgi:hypothetical protein
MGWGEGSQSLGGDQPVDPTRTRRVSGTISRPPTYKHTQQYAQHTTAAVPPPNLHLRSIFDKRFTCRKPLRKNQTTVMLSGKLAVGGGTFDTVGEFVRGDRQTFHS